MKILITGANGFLGHYLAGALLRQGYTVMATGKGPCRLPFTGQEGFSYTAMDFTDPEQVEQVTSSFNPGWLVHAGAVSKPDDCANDKPGAWDTNVQGTINLLGAAAACRSFFLFMSTDFVFDGERGMYSEEDAMAPVNYYGETKAAAEAYVKQYPHAWAIARTVLVYGKPLTGRGNLLSVVKEKLEKGEPYSVFEDQVRTPTYIGDLVDGLMAIIAKKATGVWHLSGTDVLTPYEMACRAAGYLGLDTGLIKKVTAADFQQPARRPAKTGFTIDKAKRELDYSPRSFEEGLRLTFS